RGRLRSRADHGRSRLLARGPAILFVALARATVDGMRGGGVLASLVLLAGAACAEPEMPRYADYPGHDWWAPYGEWWAADCCAHVLLRPVHHHHHHHKGSGGHHGGGHGGGHHGAGGHH